jgi:AAA domain
MTQPPLIYQPAKRGNVAVLVMIAGPSGSGKTKSALRLATGLAGDKPIGFCDTEHGRALYYADEFSFLHGELKEPFNPASFEAAAVLSQKAGHGVWICDSFSHEHVGPGGVLDMQEAELQRMVPKGEWDRREQMKYAAWIKPKMAHKHLLQRLWQLNAHIILCCHAEKKLELIKNDKGKIVPNPDAGFSPVCAPDIPYAMTFSVMLDASAPGVPRWLKRFDKIEPLIDMTKPIDEETGARIAAWARGDKPPPFLAPRSRQVEPPQPPLETPHEPDPPADRPQDETPEPPPAEPPPEEKPPPQDKALGIALGLIAEYEATTTLHEHFGLVDDAKKRSQVEWMRKKRKDLFEKVNEAVAESYRRNQLPPDTPEGSLA